jgi:hypothetical protein
MEHVNPSLSRGDWYWQVIVLLGLLYEDYSHKLPTTEKIIIACWTIIEIIRSGF